MQGLKDELKRLKLQASAPATRTAETSTELDQLRRENAELKKQMAKLTNDQQDLQKFVDSMAEQFSARATSSAGKIKVRR